MTKTKYLFTLILIAVPLIGQEPIDWEMVTKIRHEAFNNSQIEETMFQLTDVLGPRLTNSPGFAVAADWAMGELKSWGMSSVKLEPWGTFGRGWTNKKTSLEMVTPRYDNLIAQPKAWTASTAGEVRGTPTVIDVKEMEDLDNYKGQLKDKIVIIRPTRSLKLNLAASARRHDAESLANLSGNQTAAAIPDFVKNREGAIKYRKDMKTTFEFFREEEVALLIQASRNDYGTINLTRGGPYAPGEAAGPPTLVASFEQVNSMVRMLDKDLPVIVVATVTNEFSDQDMKAYNIIAEIPGTDRKLKDEIVMLGGHFDSWHASTGATDNAAGSVVGMEAMRILKALKVSPKRTIRLVLWSGEEQGLLGSKGYRDNHFGDYRTMKLKPEQKKISAYYNLDNGGGKIRGVYMQGNGAVRPIFEQWLKPFNDLGATDLTIRSTGGTDHLTFDSVGIPGFQFIQDPLEYGSKTHHTNMDTYDHIVMTDLQQAAAVMASFVYHTAQRGGMIPRKPLPKKIDQAD